MNITMKVHLLDPACKPFKAFDTDTGYDVRARLNKMVSIGQHCSMLIPTGIRVELPEGYGLQIRPRSGLAKNGIVAELGTIDNQYRGELAVILTNNSEQPYHLLPYERIAQIVAEQVIMLDMELTESLTETDRNDKGFGSSGR